MDPELLEKFTSHLKSVLVRAYTLAHELNEDTIRIEHVVWSLLTERGSIGAEILSKSQVSAEQLRNKMAARVGPDGESTLPEGTIPKLSDDTKRAIEKAVHTAHLHDHKYVGTEHLLSGIIESDPDMLRETLQTAPADIEHVRQQLSLVLKSASSFPELTEGLTPKAAPTRTKHKENAPRTDTRKKSSKTPALDFFTVDLTQAEAQKRIDPVIGRENEIDRLIEILCRRTKNNPLLIGEPGVGKTAIVEGLAKRIVDGRVPDVLCKKRILALDLALVVAGTMYRGEFEGRLKQILDEVKQQPDVVLFLDEVHTITGAGSASGSLDAANMLKPALARGDIRCIGATTYAEYKKHIESDAALDRRFQSIDVREPTADEARDIVLGLKKYYEAFHRVTITPRAVEAAVDLANRYLPDRAFPDKAIDIIDEAAARVRVHAATPSIGKEVRALELKVAEARQKKQEAVADEQYVAALEWKEKENQLHAALAAERATLATEHLAPIGRVDVGDVRTIVARRTGIPVETLAAHERMALAELEQRFDEVIVGQSHVIRGVAHAIRRARAGLTDPRRPLASFLFMGPSGVGKTELAKQIARIVFADQNALIRLDMSEFGESFTVSKLLGAPAGYVGYRDGNKFTDTVKRRPYAVVLFDEVEKAHPDVLHILLQILEDGQLTDATGKKISFTQTIVILTSNIGADRYMHGSLGFSENGSVPADDDIKREALAHFRPELVNRLDRIFVFHPLTAEQLVAIARTELGAFAARCLARHVQLAIDPTVAEHIAALATSPEKGARAIRTLVQEHIEAPVAEHLLGITTRRHNLLMHLVDGKITLTPQEARKKAPLVG